MKRAAILLGSFAVVFALGFIVGVILLTPPEPSPASYAIPHGARPVR